ncbi:hypothetical protein EIP91_007207 [Steccherinum ochraceum]|uniref:F-box domain-containing protein n=1 Tax=Steccherinum ochraceum TaxID=92696 RepID=A0A4R0RF32_9APHY|nr:hypothetical protein EIP91_007207 [Steccherinum ochraceum]
MLFLGSSVPGLMLIPSSSSRHDISGPMMNWDVLLAVLSCTRPQHASFEAGIVSNRDADRTYLLALMRTCGTLYTAGIPLLLQGKVRIATGTKNFESFRDFILAEPRRADRVKWLSLAPSNPDPTMMDTSSLPVSRKEDFTAFVDFLPFLRLFRNLTRLELFSAEEVLKTGTGDGAANILKHLEALTHFRIHEASRNIEIVVRSMRCPLQFVDLHWKEEGAHLVSEAQGLFSCLLPHASTLTHICITNPSSFEVAGLFPNVHTLRVDCFSISHHPPIHDAFVTTFPSLRRLEWIGKEFFVDPLEHHLLAVLQPVDQSGAARGSPRWRLDVLTCNVRSAYISRFRYRANFWDVSQHLHPLGLITFHEVLRAVKPKFLRLKIRDYGLNAIRKEEMFPPDVQTFSHLQMKIFCTKNNDADCHDWQILVDNITSMLRHLTHVAFISLVFSYQKSTTASNSALQQCTAAEEPLYRFGLDDAAKRVAEDLPQLRWLAIAYQEGGGDLRNRSFWKPAREFMADKVRMEHVRDIDTAERDAIPFEL